MRYLMVAGRWARMVNGKLEKYKKGDFVELNAGEARGIAMLVTPAPVEAPRPAAVKAVPAPREKE